MPEDADFSPAPWAAAPTFSAARSAYDAHVGRGYADAVAKGVTINDLLPDRITSEAAAPIVIVCDGTASMGDWPATIFSKLPYLDHEAKFYFEEDYEISFGVFNDVYDRAKYPVQMRPFSKEKDLEKSLKELVIEGGGGGQMMESAELPALYAIHNIALPNAVKPIYIFITDEKCWDPVAVETAKDHCKVEIQDRLSAREIFDQLQKKFSVYLIRKPYGYSDGDKESVPSAEVRLFWENMLPLENICFLPDPNRVVDVIFGIFAKEAGKIKEFRKELADRQGKDKDGKKKIDIVMKSLMTVHRDANAADRGLPHKHSLKKLAGPKGASVTRRADGGAGATEAKGLLDD